MKKEDYGIIIPVAVTLLSTIMAEAIQNFACKMLFIICIVAGCILLLSYQNKKVKWKKITFIVLFSISIFIFAIVPVFTKQPQIYVTRLLDFFNSNNDTANNPDVYSELNQIEESLNELSNNIDTKEFFENKKNQSEVKEIYLKIIDAINDDKETNYFSNIETDKYELELFYKMRLQGEYCYCNVIDGLKMYGVDCDAMYIDEYKLMLWDFDMLFAINNIKTSIQKDLNDETKYDKKSFDFDEFRATSPSYNDTFDYDGWQQSYENVTAAEINKKLEKRIKEYYEKFNLNFRK